MDRALRCNSLKCRTELSKQAAVTTCSHIFCLECAKLLQLINPPLGQQRICPACETPLLNPDDAVIANLNPTDDYKTSVLSGLSPTVVMECAGRALSFWAYQNTQELVYQEYQARTLTEKYSSLSVQMDKIVLDANTEISDIRGRLSTLHANYEALVRKNMELMHALREKNRMQLQNQQLYDKLKGRAMLSQIRDAASDAVDHKIQGSATENRFVEPSSGLNESRGPASHFLDGDGDLAEPDLNSNVGYEITRTGSIQMANSNGISRWNGLGRHENNHNNIVQTPSSHRQLLNPAGNNEIGLSNLPDGRSIGSQGRNNTGRQSNSQYFPIHITPLSQHRDPPRRSPLSALNANSTAGNGFAGYGMSAGIKVSHLPHENYSIRPTVRSRVANRPASTASVAGHVPSFRGPAPNQFQAPGRCY